MKKFLLYFLMLCAMVQASAQQMNTTVQRWVAEEPLYRGNYFLTDMALNTAEHVLLYQLPDGGWPKGIYYPAEMSALEVQNAEQKKKDLKSSLIEKTTIAEIHFMSNMYQATTRKRYRKAAEDGLLYVLNTQLPNGAWPLLQKEGRNLMTYADNSFVDIMLTLKRISEGKAPYDYFSAEIRKRCKEAFDKGVSFILASQCTNANHELTVWCTFYDTETIQPCAGAKYEPLALNSLVSDDLVYLLLSVKEPSLSIQKAVMGALNWYDAHKITGLARQNYVNKQGKRDFKYIDDRHAPDMWSRYYTIDDSTPYFCEADGEQKPTIDDLSYDARRAISWYNNDGIKLLRATAPSAHRSQP
ncbi:MAG: pectate lyase [Bacteroidaceae bacterium]|nr:pectate lyase [Bacteroidaceae bacterium]